MCAETTLYRPRRTGERKRKSVRGCICGPDLAVIFLKVLEKGLGEVPGLTDAERPRRLGPKRANHIRSAFALRKKDDVRKYVVSRKVEKKVKKQLAAVSSKKRKAEDSESDDGECFLLDELTKGIDGFNYEAMDDLKIDDDDEVTV